MCGLFVLCNERTNSEQGGVVIVNTQMFYQGQVSCWINQLIDRKNLMENKPTGKANSLAICIVVTAWVEFCILQLIWIDRYAMVLYVECL